MYLPVVFPGTASMLWSENLQHFGPFPFGRYSAIYFSVQCSEIIDQTTSVIDVEFREQALWNVPVGNG